MFEQHGPETGKRGGKTRCSWKFNCCTETDTEIWISNQTSPGAPDEQVKRPPEISVWVSHKHIQLNMPKVK